MTFNKNNFKTEIEDFSGLVLVDFFAEWCGPCKMMAPIIEEMIKENKDENVKIGKLNLDENQEIAAQYDVMSIPTFVVFKNGKAVDKKVGYGSKEDIEQLISKNK
ncbi:MAG: thioredoxin [Parcubacteria group bacterium]|nr:thioredoxin [Parcubacteria group bacterium]